MAQISTKKDSKQQNTLCNISNALLECYVKKGNLVAMKILFFIATKRISSSGNYVIFDINTKSLCDFCQIDFKTLKRNIIQMTETSISITDEKSESYTSVISYAKFNYNADLRVEIRENILKLINETKNQFTIIDANNIMQLTSKHSIRMLMLLEYISGFSSNVAKRKTYTLDELNLLFGTNYKRINHFEENILVPIKDELDATSKISFEYQINYDKIHRTAGRAKAVSVTIDLIQRKFTQGTL
jgi:hypothetical protein